MSHNGTAAADREGRLGEVLADWLEAAERGAPPEAADYLRRYPEFAAELAQCFADWRRLPRPPAAPEPALPERGLLGDFRLLREVGRGGMGVVYEAEQLSLRRRVALKVLPAAGLLDPRQLQRFKNEAQAAACLHHPGIVPVHYVGCERGVHFYAMQFIDGHNLAHLLDQLRRPAGDKPADTMPAAPAETGDGRTAAYEAPPAATAAEAGRDTLLSWGPGRGRAYFRRVAELGAQAAEALDYAHGLGVVHRDVKPANLLLDAAGRLWVTDFGLAQFRQAEGSLTVTGDLVGTLRYMSPEQALAKRVVVDHRTDVYSLGATLYELLALRPAFGGRDGQEVLRQIAFEDPAPPRRRDRRVPAELETVVLKALEKRPEDRYQTAQELADDLRRFLGDRPIKARRPSLAQRAAKWARRHRPAVATAAVALLALAAVLGANLVWWAQRRGAAEGATREALAGARTAIEAGDLMLARQRVAEALGRLGIERATLPGLAADIDHTRDEIAVARPASLGA